MSGPPFPGLDHLGVQRLAGAHAPAQAGLALGQILEHEHPVSRGRRAESGDGVALEQVKRLRRAELPAGVLHEERRAHVPGSEEARPGSLGPARLGEVQVEVIRAEVEPQPACDDVPDRVGGVRVQHHLRIADGARGEVDQSRVGGRRVGRFGITGGRHLALVGEPAVAGLTDRDQRLQARTFPPDLVDFHRVVGIADISDPLRQRGPVLDVLRRQQDRAGHRDGAGLEAAEEHFPPGRQAWQLDHHAVAGLDAVLLEHGREAVGGQ